MGFLIHKIWQILKRFSRQNLLSWCENLFFSGDYTTNQNLGNFLNNLNKLSKLYHTNVAPGLCMLYSTLICPLSNAKMDFIPIIYFRLFRIIVSYLFFSFRIIRQIKKKFNLVLICVNNLFEDLASITELDL